MNKLWAQVLISLMIIIPFWGIIYLVTMYGLHLDPEIKGFIKDLMMQILPVVTAITGYWIGSSHGSANKDQIIADMAKGETK